MPNFEQSDLMTKFYTEYLIWVNAGAPRSPIFNRGAGLCYNMQSYVRATTKDKANTYNIRLSMEREMEDQFLDAGLSGIYPFGGHDQYYRELRSSQLHLNLQRIQWVKDHAI